MPRVLAVDDEPGVRESLRMLLRDVAAARVEDLESLDPGRLELLDRRPAVV